MIQIKNFIIVEAMIYKLMIYITIYILGKTSFWKMSDGCNDIYKLLFELSVMINMNGINLCSLTIVNINNLFNNIVT